MISGLESKENIEKKDLPIFLMCPISYDEMVDPVVELSGQSGERKNMAQSIAKYGRCAFDRTIAMLPQQLITNTALKYAIKDYKESKRENLFAHYLAISIKKLKS